MARHNAVFSQFLKLTPRHFFNRFAEGNHCGRKLRVMTRWSQFVALTMGQLSGSQSLARHRGQLDERVVPSSSSTRATRIMPSMRS